jgi:hypothetical protein
MRFGCGWYRAPGAMLNFAAALVALSSGASRAQGASPALPPLPHAVLNQLVRDPEAWRQFRALYATLPEAPSDSTAAASKSAWIPLKHPFPGKRAKPNVSFGASNPLLLGDGSVIVHVSCSPIWYRLTPVNGSYVAGVWSTIAPMPNGYSPRFFASAVLPDGRVIVEGGEYSGAGCKRTDSDEGAIYDPRSDSWRLVQPPADWASISDASSTILANGSYLLSNALTRQTALLNTATMAWTATGNDKFDENDEENWTLLPNGDVLTVDAYSDLLPKCGTNSEAYVPGTGDWTSAGSTIFKLSGCSGTYKTYEAPTQILRPNGTVAAFGATASTQNVPVHSAIYNTAKAAWAAGPKLPAVDGLYYTVVDGPAAILPNGDALVAASPAQWSSKVAYPKPTHFFVFDGSSFTQVDDVKDSSVLRSYEMNFLVLPTGEILAVETDFANVEIFPAACCAAKSWKPTITSFPSAIIDGNGYTISGTQFNGLTSGAAVGDDDQAYTNYPIVRVTNTATKAITYCSTYDWSSSGVATGDTIVSTLFTCAAPPGPSSLEVVANGIASAPVSITISEDLEQLSSFCTGGGAPCGPGQYAGLLIDPARNLYGTTQGGGANGQGTIFELQFDQATQEYASTPTTLYSFCSEGGAECTDGAQPVANLLMDASGNLFGTTWEGGTGYSTVDQPIGAGGTIFELAFDAASQQFSPTITTLYSFCSEGGSQCTDGQAPGPLVMDSFGDLYGTTAYGGLSVNNPAQGITIEGGTLFTLPLEGGAYPSKVQTLYKFCSQGGNKCTDGYHPNGVTIDLSTNLYGTTQGGGTGPYAYSEGVTFGGTAYLLPYNAATNSYADTVQTIYSFCSQGGKQCTDGSDPAGNLVEDVAGNFYGTTTFYGTGGQVGGTIFELPLNPTTGTYGGMTSLYNFCSNSGEPACAVGAFPMNLVIDPLGNLDGTTQNAPTLYQLPLDTATGIYAESPAVLTGFSESAPAPVLLNHFSGVLYEPISSGLFKFTP